MPISGLSIISIMVSFTNSLSGLFFLNVSNKNLVIDWKAKKHPHKKTMGHLSFEINPFAYLYPSLGLESVLGIYLLEIVSK